MEVIEKMSNPLYTQWFQKSTDTLKTSDGKDVEIWEFNHIPDDRIMSDWAKHFRNQYCDDLKIDKYRKGTGLSRSEYLTQIKFPDEKIYPGPQIRSGDFCEVLLMDFFQFLQGYFLPRTRYKDKIRRNSSPQGSDIIALKRNPKIKFDKNDEMFIIESKGKLTGSLTVEDNTLQNAINDSSKKEKLRIAESLAAMKEKYINMNDDPSAEIIERFQNKTDNDYKIRYGAATVLSNTVYNEGILKQTDASSYSSTDIVSLYVFRGEKMMDLVTSLYKRAADEA